MLPPVVRDCIFDAIKSLHNIRVTFICSKTSANHSSLKKSDNYKKNSNTVFKVFLNKKAVILNLLAPQFYI
jgi:hypothetical protein